MDPTLQCEVLRVLRSNDPVDLPSHAAVAALRYLLALSDSQQSQIAKLEARLAVLEAPAVEAEPSPFFDDQAHDDFHDVEPGHDDEPRYEEPAVLLAAEPVALAEEITAPPELQPLAELGAVEHALP